jgi:hypothetical protein
MCFFTVLKDNEQKIILIHDIKNKWNCMVNHKVGTEMGHIGRGEIERDKKGR